MTVETITPYDSSPLRSLFALALVMMSSPEAETACSCSGNQEQEFLDLIKREDSLISGICFSYAGSVAEYDDLRQDALINIWRGLPSFKGDSSSRTWIYRVVINSCVSTIRRQIRHTRASESLDRLYDLVSDEPDTDRERIETLHRLIATLHAEDKAIILMWLDDAGYDDISAVMGMPRNTVATRLHRIKEKLARIRHKFE